METPISEFKSYTENLAAGLQEKLFFADRFSENEEFLFVDFGCADGQLLRALSSAREAKRFAEKESNAAFGFSSEIFQKDDYIGYDKSKSMIAMAKSCGTGEKSEERISFTDSLETVVEKVKNSSINSVLILSSVIHEVYSYGKKKDIAEFWNFVLNTGFDYVVVRDMCPTADIDRQTPAEVLRFFNNNISEERKRQIKEFEERWGSLKENRNFVHFILKYRWIQNWDRELNENYLSYNCDEFLSKMVSKFNIDYFERFRVPFLEKCILEEFKLKLADFTHIKGVFSTR